HPFEARVSLRTAWRGVPGRRWTDRGLRRHSGRPLDRTPGPHLQGRARRRRSPDRPDGAELDRGTDRSAIVHRRAGPAIPREGDPHAAGGGDPDRSPAGGRDPSRAERKVPRREVDGGKEHPVIRTSVARCRPGYAGLAPPWGPGRAYPEIARLFGGRYCEGPENPVYAAVRNALHALGLDAGRYGSPDWNPIGSLVAPGKQIVLKPNLIRHWNPAADGRGGT